MGIRKISELEQMAAPSASSNVLVEDGGKTKRIPAVAFISGGMGASSYYSTTREEVGKAHEDINAEYIFSLYDALMAEHPGKVRKNEVTNDDGTFTNYEYVISTGDHNEENKGYYEWRDLGIKKPKYLILSGVHGTERPAVISTYRFVRDLLAGENELANLLEGSIIHILPVGTPEAFDAFTYENANNVNINRNFDDAVLEKESQAISNWLNANSDAVLFIDHHNGGAVSDVTFVFGPPDNYAVDTAKKIALRGLDRIIPYWRDVVGYSKTLVDRDGIVQDVVFSYSMSKDIPGCTTQYAVDKYGITSLTLETAVYQNGDYADYERDQKVCTPETVAAGAEALGNILIEFYEQMFVGGMFEDMKDIENKLDIIINGMNNGFRIESGVLVVNEDVGSNASPFTLKIPCTSGAKTAVIQADDETYTAITSTAQDDSHFWFIGAMGNCITQVGNKPHRAFLSRMEIVVMGSTTKWTPTDRSTSCDNTDGYAFPTTGVKAGRYNWTAYYWNE